MKNFEQTTETIENSDLKHLYLFFYLIPIVGFFPSLWTLYRGARDEGQGVRDEQQPTRQGGQSSNPTTQQKEKFTIQNPKSKIQNSLTPHPSPLTSHPSLAVSRLSVTLAFAWLLSYLLLNIGAETSEFLTLRLLVLNSFLTSGYFLVSIWLMVRLAMGKSVRLPGFTTLAERVIGKNLS